QSRSIILTTTLFGPLLGFLMGALFTKVYVDAIFIDTEKLNITTDDPRWIGAWWAGFLVCAVLLFFTSLIMFGFPRSMPLKHFPENKLSKLLLPIKEPKDNSIFRHPLKHQLTWRNPSAILNVTKQLLQNPVFACIVLAACMGLAAIGGMSAFLGKYLESQFGLNTAYANQLIGVAAIPCVCLGMFLGGYLVKKCNLTPVGIVKLGMAANMLCSAAFVFLLFLGCETGPVAGLTSGYMNRTGWDFPKNLTSWCNEECGCTLETLNPICGSDGITYMSPCFAGCIDTNFTSCACINTGIPIGAAAVPGQCPSSGCQGTFHVFFAVFCTGCFIGAMGHTPTVVILIRYESTFSLFVYLISFIPMPLVFGAAIDSTCLAWSESCGKRRTCSLYNNDSYRYLYFSISVGLKTAAFILMTIVWHCIKSNPKKYLHGDEDILNTPWPDMAQTKN
uniref:Solute carrier organic anion transporter family member n=1 Tax=Erpetoichthys calabaricus TaxID=27687 RepID=A0A8C4RY24_ERPCA